MSECTCHTKLYLGHPDPEGWRDHRYPSGNTGCQNLPRGKHPREASFLSICRDSAQWSAHRASAKECFPLLLHLQIKEYQEFSIKKVRKANGLSPQPQCGR